MRKALFNLVVLLSQPVAAWAADPASPPAPNGDDAWISLLVPLIAVTAGLLALLWWLRRGRTLSGGNRGPLKIVQAMALGTRERIVVVDAQDRRLLLGVTAQRIELIAELRTEQARAEQQEP